jgi:glucose/arabinose dehydrogenase
MVSISQIATSVGHIRVIFSNLGASNVKAGNMGIFALLICSVAFPVHALGQASVGESASEYDVVTLATSAASTWSRDKYWKPGDDQVPLEISGMCTLPGGRLAVAIRRGEVWFIDGAYDRTGKTLKLHRFASALHEPLGLAPYRGGLCTVQRTEVTLLRDTDGDDVADDYETLNQSWGVSGNYHEYAYGPIVDKEDNLWITLNIGMGFQGDQKGHLLKSSWGGPQAKWRGWGAQISAAGEFIPLAAGMRSPSGLGDNLQGDVFFTDQQGNWIPVCSLHHLRKGAFYGHPDALASTVLPGGKLPGITEIPNGIPYPEAVKKVPALVPPAVWFPYKKVGQSATDVVCDTTKGKFGPFAGQLFVGEFTLASISRVFLEQVDGEYQGACFPFYEGLDSAVIRLSFGEDGSLFAGLSNRGWSSVGRASYGLQRLIWNGSVPFEIKEMKARPDGFELVFTKPVDLATAADLNSYQMKSYTYQYHQTYGSDELFTQPVKIQSATVSEDGLRVKLEMTGLRELYVHELVAAGIRSAHGDPLKHADAYYTLNRIPK